MKVIRLAASFFETLLPLIKEQESNGLRFLHDREDGIIGRVGIDARCAKLVYFEDGKREVTFEDRTT